MENSAENSILIVDDDTEIGELLTSYLKKYSFNAMSCDDPEKAIALVKNQNFNVLLIDKNMPILDGIELTRQIRQFSEVPIIMMTASDDESDRISALGQQINAYLAKPFSFRVLLARIHAVLRRDKLTQQSQIKSTAQTIISYSFENWKLNCVKQILLTDQNQTIELSTMEYDLLHNLVANAGNIISREELLANTQTHLPLGMNDRRIDVIISKLRSKLSLELSKRLKSVRNSGYVFNCQVTPEFEKI